MKKTPASEPVDHSRRERGLRRIEDQGPVAASPSLRVSFAGSDKGREPRAQAFAAPVYLDLQRAPNGHHDLHEIVGVERAGTVIGADVQSRSHPNVPISEACGPETTIRHMPPSVAIIRPNIMAATRDLDSSSARRSSG